MKDAAHKLGLGISLIALAAILFLGKGPVMYGSLLGVGMFVTLFVVSLRQPRVLIWCRAHPASTEILSTLGTFIIFNAFGGGTVTAAVASTIVCLMCTAVLGFSKLEWMNRWINQSMDHAEEVVEMIRPQPSAEQAKDAGFRPLKIKQPRKRDRVAEAIARAVKAGV